MSSDRILIKGGEVVNEDGRQRADVYIEDKIIKQVGLNLEVPGGARVIDATGKMVIPGGIDTHTHCQMPFMGTFAVDDFYIGTKVMLHNRLVYHRSHLKLTKNHLHNLLLAFPLLTPNQQAEAYRVFLRF